jgi:hypothetical protein
MAANDMTDALKHPRHGFPLVTDGDDTITSLAQLSKKIKDKFKKLLAPEISQASIMAAENNNELHLC